MKKTLGIILLFSILISGCTSEGIIEEKIIESDFDKKERCAEYIDNIFRQEKSHRQAANMTGEYTIDEVFYSPIIDSCLYVIKEQPLDDITYKSMFVIDALTLKIINQMFIPISSLYDKTAYKDENDFEDIVKELKGQIENNL